jgi:DNA-binding PadR family transcriptional regulator
MSPHWSYEHEARRGPRMERGDLRYVILSLLDERPSYGYEIIRALEDRFHGFYSPSPGTVYPTLQWLQDLGYVTASEENGRTMYTITDEGRRFLAAQGPKVEEVWDRMGGWWDASGFDPRQFHREMRDFGRDLGEMFKNLKHDARWASPEKMRRVREVIARAGREIDDILREPEPRPSEPGPDHPRTPDDTVRDV